MWSITLGCLAAVLSAKQQVQQSKQIHEHYQSQFEAAKHLAYILKNQSLVKKVETQGCCTQCGAKMSMVRNGVKICQFCKSDL